MSALAAGGRFARPRRAPLRAAAAAPVRETLLRLGAFAALALFAAAHYARLVADPPAARIAGTIAIATAEAAVLAVIARSRPRAIVAAALAVATAIASAWGALLAIGVPGTLLLPAHWSALVDDVRGGLGGLTGFDWPYAGPDAWVRLAALLAIPATAVAAAAVSFWPSRRWLEPRRTVALALLVALYAVGVVEYPAGGWAARGGALLALVAAWLWLPAIGRRDAPGAAAALVAAAAVALGLTAVAHSNHPLVDYRAWNVFSGVGGGTEFTWDQVYGPITWPRGETPLLSVRSRSPHYWKAETLDRFDGLRFMHSIVTPAPVPSASLPLRLDQHWVERVQFQVTGLRSNLVVSPGTALSIETSKVVSNDPDGATRAVDAPLSRGDTYSVTAYVPQPGPARLRAAPLVFPRAFLPYTSFDLPSPRQSGLAPPDLGPSARQVFTTARTIQATTPGVAAAADPAVAARILASPYARAYRLARQLAAGRRTPYDVAAAIEGYLQHGYSYSEKPPRRRYPLAAFLFEDRTGYCQQFSGAMTLLLRMDGIPARVAVGFAPGGYDPGSGRYIVRALDAHAWVEVFFSGIGWVPFDPTPTVAPEVIHSSPDPASAATHQSPVDAGGLSFAPRSERATDTPNGRHRGRRRSGSGAVTAALVALAAAATAALLASRALVARRRRSGDDVLVDEFVRALARAGHACPPGTTLLGLERRLAVTSGPAAARYARAMRELRFDVPARARRPSAGDRRALRRELAAGRGPLVRLRLLATLPPEPRPVLALLNLLPLHIGR